MPYATPFDETTPTDASWAYEGDDELRKIKRALNERFGGLFSNWPDGDPLLFAEGAISGQFTAAPLTERPNPPTLDDLLFYATDTDQLYNSGPKTGGGFEWHEVKPTSVSNPAILVISAGESRFDPTGEETHAARVNNAILSAKLSDAPVKTVFVPKSFWNYSVDSDFSLGMFDPNVLMIREGSMAGWYDPVAYGADLSGTRNSRDIIDLCYTHASTSTIGMKAVAFTVPGVYTMNSDVDQRACATILMPGAAPSGTGKLTGTRAFKLPFDFRAFNYNVDAAVGAKAVEVAATKVLMLHVTSAATDASGQVYVNFSETGFAGYYAAANVVGCLATYRHQATQSPEFIPYSIDVAGNRILLDLDGGAQVADWDLLILFSA